MYQITKKEWSELKRKYPDYTGKSLERHEHNGMICEKGENTCFLSILPNATEKGCVLGFEHIHFEII